VTPFPRQRLLTNKETALSLAGEEQSQGQKRIFLGVVLFNNDFPHPPKNFAIYVREHAHSP
jgi:hypothetical protein